MGGLDFLYLVGCGDCYHCPCWFYCFTPFSVRFKRITCHYNRKRLRSCLYRPKRVVWKINKNPCNIKKYLYFCINDSVANDYRFVAEGGVFIYSSDFLNNFFNIVPSISHISSINCPFEILLLMHLFM